MRLALFDLDETLIHGDTDAEWARFLCDVGAVDQASFQEASDTFYAAYKAGRLDMQAFLRFQLRPLAEHPRQQLDAWRATFIEERITPRVKPGARELIASHARHGRVLAIVTATNRYLTEPVAALFGVPHLVATEPEVRDGRFTGGVEGVPCFREGKLERVDAWLASRGASWAAVAESWFYSDSRNDLPLLSRVTHAVAVDPDEVLAAHAEANGWEILHLTQ